MIESVTLTDGTRIDQSGAIYSILAFKIETDAHDESFMPTVYLRQRSSATGDILAELKIGSARVAAITYVSSDRF